MYENVTNSNWSYTTHAYSLLDSRFDFPRGPCLDTGGINRMPLDMRGLDSTQSSIPPVLRTSGCTTHCPTLLQLSNMLHKYLQLSIGERECEQSPYIILLR
jgi:hypothetical protein